MSMRGKTLSLLLLLARRRHSRGVGGWGAKIVVVAAVAAEGQTIAERNSRSEGQDTKKS